MSRHCLLQFLVANIVLVPPTYAMGDRLLQLWPDQNMLDESPKYWHQYIKSLLHHTLDNQRVMPIDQDLSALFFELYHSTLHKLMEVLHGARKNNPDSIKCTRTQNGNTRTFKNNITVLQAFGQILHGRYLYKSCIEKLMMESSDFSVHIIYTWCFNLDKTLAPNLTIDQIEIDRVNDICVLNYLLVRLSISVHGQVRYCGKQPPFSLYPPNHVVFVEYRLNITAKTHHHIEMHHSVFDPGILKSIDPWIHGSIFNNKSDTLLLHVHRIGVYPVHTIESFLVQLHKVYNLILQPIDCSNRCILVFDGPGPLSPRLTAHNMTHQMSSFQSFVQTLTSLKQVDSCLLNYFPTESSSVHTISVTERALFLYSQQICTLSPCIMLLKTQNSSQVNITLTHMNYFANGSLGCRYGGLSALELHPQIHEELICKPYAKQNVHPNLYSQRSQIFCILFWYKEYSFADVELHVSMVKCRAVRIDICAQAMCLHTDCETYFNSLSLQFGVTVTYEELVFTKFMGGGHRMKTVHIVMENQSCVVVQARNEGLKKHLFGTGALVRAFLHTCSMVFNFNFFFSYVRYQITGNISSQTFRMHTFGLADEVCFTTTLGSDSSLMVQCQQFQRFFEGPFRAPFFSMRTIKQSKGKKNDVFFLDLPLERSSAVDFIIKNCPFVDSPSECGVSNFMFDLERFRRIFPENKMLQQFVYQVAHQSVINFPLDTSPLKKELFILCLTTDIKFADSVHLVGLSLANDNIQGYLTLPFTTYQRRRLVKIYEQNEDTYIELVFLNQTEQQSVLTIWILDNSSDLHNVKKVPCQSLPQKPLKMDCYETHTPTKEQYNLHVSDKALSWTDAFSLCRNVEEHLPTTTSNRGLRKLLSVLEKVYPKFVIEALFVGLLFSQKVSVNDCQVCFVCCGYLSEHCLKLL